MLEQNYSSHMKSIHNSKETKDASQMPLKFTFQSKPKKMPWLDTAEIKIQQEVPSDSERGNAQGTTKTNSSRKEETPIEKSVCNLDRGKISQNEEHCSETECIVADKIVRDLLPAFLEEEEDHRSEISSLKSGVCMLKESVEFLKEELNRSKSEKRSSVTLPQETLNVFDDETLLRKCKSVQDPLRYFPELELVNADSTLVCRVCIPDKVVAIHSGNALPSGMFLVPAETEGVNEIMSRALRNLKVSIFRHLKRDSHQQAIQHDKNLNENYEKEACRSNKIAMHIGSACYRLYYRGRPYTDLEDDLLLLYRFGVEVGDINHSHKFAQNYLHSVAEVVKGKIQGFLNTRMPRTGFMPPIKVLADKATYKHRTRQFVGVATMVPDADDLIQYIYIYGHLLLRSMMKKILGKV